MTDAAPRASLSHLAAEVAGGRLIPVLGPDVLTLGDGPPCVPTGARALSQGKASSRCRFVHSPVGCSVTARLRIRLRSWLSTTKP